MKTFEQALAHTGPLMAAWDLSPQQEGRVRLYAVGNAGAQMLAEQDVEPKKREPLTDELRARNVRIGSTYAGMPVVWAIDDSGYAIWSHDALKASGKRASDIARIITFYDPADLGHRGVKLGLRGGSEETLVEERDPASQIDPGYNEDNLFMEGVWATHLGRQLATWLGVPHEDQIADTTNERQLAIAGAARTLAETVERAPADGEFEHVLAPLGTIEPTGGLAFRFAPDPLHLERRFLELRVTSKSGKTTSARWMKLGSNAQIATFLRDAATPDKVMDTMLDLLRKQEES